MTLSLEQLMLQDLRQAQHLVKLCAEPPLSSQTLGWQFHILTPGGSYWTALAQDYDTAEEKAQQLTHLKAFMASKLTTAFTLVMHLTTPAALIAQGVSQDKAFMAISFIFPGTLGMSAPHLMQPAAIDSAVLDLLPTRTSQIDQRGLEQMDAYFGPGGKRPAMLLPPAEREQIPGHPH